MNCFIKVNFKNLLPSVNFHVAGSAIAFPRISYRTFLIGITVGCDLLQMLQSKMKISLQVLPVTPAENLQIHLQ